MTAKTDPAAPDDSAASSQHTQHPVPPPTNPHFALFVATAGGLGYFPKAPGTLGSLVGLLLALLPTWIFFGLTVAITSATHRFQNVLCTRQLGTRSVPMDRRSLGPCFTAGIGVWASARVAKRFREKDPQYVVIDEVSGQHLTLLLGCGIPIWWKATQPIWNTMSLTY